MSRLDVDKYLAKTHHITEYNCWDFIREIWIDLTGEDIGKRTPPSGTRSDMKLKFAEEEAHFIKLDGPANPSIVLFKRPRLLPHVGICIKHVGKWRILHLAEGGSGKLEPVELASLGFTEIGYFKWQM